MLIGRYRNPNAVDYVRLQLSGSSNQSKRTFFYDNQRFPLREESNDYLPRLWATRRVGWLMEQIRANGEQKELSDEIVDLGTRYGIVTPYTSYLALEPGAEPKEISRTPRTFGGITGRTAPAPRADMNAATGIGAVRQSKQTRDYQEAEQVAVTAAPSVTRVVAEKTFYLRDKVWTDSEFKADAKLPETVLKFGSNEYFELLKAKPRLAEFFALGEQVIVVFDGRVYRTTAGTP